jgi:hypothetical protein
VKLGVSESAGCECERTAGQERRPDGVHGREEVHRARAHGLMALETKKEKRRRTRFASESSYILAYKQSQPTQDAELYFSKNTAINLYLNT